MIHGYEKPMLEHLTLLDGMGYSRAHLKILFFVRGNESTDENKNIYIYVN